MGDRDIVDERGGDNGKGGLGVAVLLDTDPLQLPLWETAVAAPSGNTLWALGHHLTSSTLSMYYPSLLLSHLSLSAGQTRLMEAFSAIHPWPSCASSRSCTLRADLAQHPAILSSVGSPAHYRIADERSSVPWGVIPGDTNLSSPGPGLISSCHAARGSCITIVPLASPEHLSSAAPLSRRRIAAERCIRGVKAVLTLTLYCHCS